MTSKFCVVGSPIVQSLSPVLHAAAYEALGLDFSYEAHEVAAGALSKFLDNNDFQGVSVTMPLKQEAFEIASERSDQSMLTGAVNTLTRASNGWSGSNSDIYGLTRALSGITPPTRTVIIGSGATARSALTAMAELFTTSTITLMARDKDAASKTVEFGQSLGLTMSSSEISAEEVAGYDLVMNVVPAGSYLELWSEVSASPKAGAGWLFDASYNPWPSLPARSWGSERVISGLEMLIWQAIEQVHLFAASSGASLNLDRSELYSVMKSAVSGK